MVTFASVEDYIAAQPALTQARLRELRAAVKGGLPEAREVISYGMPTYKLPGGFVSFGAAKGHCALYGAAMDACADELRGYSTAKGTVRFPLDQPIPEVLVRKLVQAKFAPTT
jgi:uncharacterized protein YdhG (YjbR/CyaY superfamily)